MSDTVITSSVADAQIQLGYGCHWGIGTSQLKLTPAYVGTGQLMPLEQDLTANHQSEPNYNPPDGSVIGETFFRKETSLRMRLYPSGPTLAQAKAMNAHVIEPGSELEVVDDSDPQIARFWSVIEVGKARRHQEKAYWDLTLRRHGDNAQPYSGTRISQLTPA